MNCVEAGYRRWSVLVMGGAPLSVRVRRVTAPEPLIYCQQIADQPQCASMAGFRRIWAVPGVRVAKPIRRLTGTKRHGDLVGEAGGDAGSFPRQSPRVCSPA
jgi:hypothetical protein